mmetsp:Transcript_27492/g.36039  ORF Transcript_27492/g.36039 Transcript_27492/m.36039 type:complete len:236 (-) Transcript_27492:951-1658(-)
MTWSWSGVCHYSRADYQKTLGVARILRPRGESHPYLGCASVQPTWISAGSWNCSAHAGAGVKGPGTHCEEHPYWWGCHPCWPLQRTLPSACQCSEPFPYERPSPANSLHWSGGSLVNSRCGGFERSEEHPIGRADGRPCWPWWWLWLVLLPCLAPLHSAHPPSGKQGPSRWRPFGHSGASFWLPVSPLFVEVPSGGHTHLLPGDIHTSLQVQAPKLKQNLTRNFPPTTDCLSLLA